MAACSSKLPHHPVVDGLGVGAKKKGFEERISRHLVIKLITGHKKSPVWGSTLEFRLDSCYFLL